MPVVWIPPQLRELTGGQQKVTVAGATVGQVIDALERRYPGLSERLCDANGLRPGIAVVVGSDVARRGLLQPVGQETEVHFLPAVSGG
jgi:molybdopterin converting factor small subunit